MIKMTRYLWLLLIPLINFSCKDELVQTQDIFHTWEAKEFISLESVSYPKIEENKILLNIESPNSYQLKLDYNQCNGQISQLSHSKIVFQSAGCTKICCDSKFSQKLVEMLPQVTSYHLDNHKLNLYIDGWGSILLQRIQLE